MTNDTSLTFADELDWGIRLQKAGVFDEAADTYSEILRQSPLHPEASFLLGSIELERRELGPACLHLAVAAGGLEAPDEAQAGFARAYEALDPASRGGVLSEIAEMLIAQDAGDRAAPALRVLRLLGETEAALSDGNSARPLSRGRRIAPHSWPTVARFRSARRSTGSNRDGARSFAERLRTSDRAFSDARPGRSTRGSIDHWPTGRRRAALPTRAPMFAERLSSS